MPMRDGPSSAANNKESDTKQSEKTQRSTRFPCVSSATRYGDGRIVACYGSTDKWIRAPVLATTLLNMLDCGPSVGFHKFLLELTRLRDDGVSPQALNAPKRTLVEAIPR